MYSLTFCVRIMLPERHQWKPAVHAATQPVHAPIANPPNSAQLGGIPYHYLKLHPGTCNSGGMRPRTDRHTDALDHNTFLVVYDSREM